MMFLIFRLRVTETDIWFKTRSLVLQEQKLQVINLQSNLEKIIQDKLSLTSATTVFHDNLSQFLGSKVVGDKQSNVGSVYRLQAEADEELRFLAHDYELLIEDVDRALVVRKEAVRKLSTVKKGADAGKADEETMQAAQEHFDSINQSMRRELEHFDTIMRDEFSTAFNDYNKKYEEALQSRKTNQF